MEQFKFVRVIGKGTYGVVLQCIDRDTKQLVAIKCFRRDSSSEEYFLQTIIRDLRVQQLLQGEPHIVKLLDTFQEGEQIYLVMEYVPRNLLEILEANPKGLEFEALRLLIYTTLLGVRSLHRRGLIHRDIKPENILVEVNGTAKLCDFGFTRPVMPVNRQGTSALATYTSSVKCLANTEDNDEQGNLSGSLNLPMLDDLVYDCNANSMTAYVSTRWYRSPEMLLGVPHYDFAVDMWAMGAILAEAADGEPLLPGDSELEQLSLIQTRVGRFSNTYKAFLQKLSSNVPYECEQVDCGLSSTSAECEVSDYLHTRFYDVLGKHGVLLLQSLLAIDSSKRITVEEALQHPFFDGLSAHYSLLLPSSRCSLSPASLKVSCVKFRDNLISSISVAKEPDRDGILPLSRPILFMSTSQRHSEKTNSTERDSIAKTKLCSPMEEVAPIDSGSLNQRKRRMILVHDSKKHEPCSKIPFPSLGPPHDDTPYLRRLESNFERPKRKPSEKNATRPINSVLFSNSGRRSTSRKALRTPIDTTTKMPLVWQHTKCNGASTGASHAPVGDRNVDPDSPLHRGSPHVKGILKTEPNGKHCSSNFWEDSFAPHNDTLSGRSDARSRCGKRSNSKGQLGKPEVCKTPFLRCPSTRSQLSHSRRLGTSTQSPYFTPMPGSFKQDTLRAPRPKPHPGPRREDPRPRDRVPGVTPGERTKPAGSFQEGRKVPDGPLTRRSQRHSSPVGLPPSSRNSEKNGVGHGLQGQRAGMTEDATCHAPTTRTPLLFFRTKKGSTASEMSALGGNLGSASSRELASLGHDMTSTQHLAPISSHLPPAVLSSHNSSGPAQGNP